MIWVRKLITLFMRLQFAYHARGSQPMSDHRNDWWLTLLFVIVLAKPNIKQSRPISFVFQNEYHFCFDHCAACVQLSTSRWNNKEIVGTRFRLSCSHLHEKQDTRIHLLSSLTRVFILFWKPGVRLMEFNQFVCHNRNKLPSCRFKFLAKRYSQIKCAPTVTYSFSVPLFPGATANWVIFIWRLIRENIIIQVVRYLYTSMWTILWTAKGVGNESNKPHGGKKGKTNVSYKWRRNWCLVTD
jgi:hypothetical protein